ncbi:MAG TPA: DUF1572 family protein [Bacteroidia bacterium]|nr:DUF1572 family protein [Bacteroidia bacterium]
MMTHDIKAILIRDHMYENTSDMWKILPGTSNSAGNLTLHLIGNLRHFIGHELGNSGYVRKRDEEFSTKNVSLTVLDSLLTICIAEISSALDGFDTTKLTNLFPKEVGGEKRDTSFVLLHLLGHFSYHLGQINYHRRMISGSGS